MKSLENHVNSFKSRLIKLLMCVRLLVSVQIIRLKYSNLFGVIYLQLFMLQWKIPSFWAGSPLLFSLQWDRLVAMWSCIYFCLLYVNELTLQRGCLLLKQGCAEILATF